MGSATDTDRQARAAGAARPRASRRPVRGRRAARDLGVLVVQRRRQPGGVRRTGSTSCLRTAGEGGDAHFATILQATGEPVGSTSFCTIREEDRGLEIGWTWLTPSVWGTGANTEAKFLQLRYAFETLGCIRVDWDTYEQNARSRAALTKLGATFEGVWRNFSIRESDGSKVSSAFYSVIDDEWPDSSERT